MRGKRGVEEDMKETNERERKKIESENTNLLPNFKRYKIRFISFISSNVKGD